MQALSKHLQLQRCCSNSSSRRAAAAGQQQSLAAAAARSAAAQRAASRLQVEQQTADVPQQPNQRSDASSSSSRRGVLGALGAAAAVVLSGVLAAEPAVAAAAAVSSSSALEEYMKLEDAGKLRDQRSLENIRGKYNIKRGIDGRVQLRRKSGAWMSVRLDMEVPGAILLRDMKTEAIYALETDGLPQVDLSDDYVLFMMFADGQWEGDMTPIEFEEEGGATKQLTMSEKEFHEFVGLLKEPDEPPAQQQKRK